MDTPKVDTTDSWTVKQELIGAHGDRKVVQATNEDSEVSMTVKEQPNGIELQFKIFADLPGGYDIIRRKTLDTVDAAVAELEQYAAMYDRDGSWTFGSTRTPLLH